MLSVSMNRTPLGTSCEWNDRDPRATEHHQHHIALDDAVAQLECANKMVFAAPHLQGVTPPTGIPDADPPPQALCAPDFC